MGDAVLPGESAPRGARERVARRLAGVVDERHGLAPAALREMLRRLVEIAQRRNLNGVVVAARETGAMGERALGPDFGDGGARRGVGDQRRARRLPIHASITQYALTFSRN